MQLSSLTCGCGGSWYVDYDNRAAAEKILACLEENLLGNIDHRASKISEPTVQSLLIGEYLMKFCWKIGFGLFVSVDLTDML